MTLILSEAEYNLVWEQNSPSHNYNLFLDDYKILEEFRKSLEQ